MKKTKFYYLLAGIIMTVISSCNKQDEFLEAKPNQALLVPSTLADLQLMLNYEHIFNNQSDPSLGMLSTDEYYVTQSVWSAASTPTERNAYIFAKDIYEGSTSIGDWRFPYLQIYYANTVLEMLGKIKYDEREQLKADQIRGTALFYRSYAFYNLLQTFAKPYNAATAQSDPGIPLRQSSDLNDRPGRASVKEGYERVLTDLGQAGNLLPDKTANKTAPSKIAVKALLARIYLAIEDYPSAFNAADQCLASFSTLVDYNTLIPQAYPISTTYFPETIYHTTGYNYGLTGFSRPVVDPSLISLFKVNDLRPSIFFIPSGGLPRFGGSYDQSGIRFTGLASDEIYLIRAECLARAGSTPDALRDLNLLLRNRWKTGTFVPVTASSRDEALRLILEERRKELCFRGLRWTDLRRLNKDPRFAITITHQLGATGYELPPGDPKYAMPIPDQEVQLTGIEQNSR